MFMKSAKTEWPGRISPADRESREAEVSAFGPAADNAARVYDCLLGGKGNFAADREVAREAVAADYGARRTVAANRAFLRRAVRYLAGEGGIRQFIDIGFPGAGNTHEAAQRVAPESVIVYVDNEPIILAHTRARLTSHEGLATCLGSDLRDSSTIVEKTCEWVDYSAPIAIMLGMILHFIPDSDDPWRIVSQLVTAVPPGSYLVVSHPAGDLRAGVQAEMVRRVNQRMPATPLTLRTHAQIGRFFNGLEMVWPGLVPLNHWRPDRPASRDEEDIAAYAGLARKAS